MTILAASAPAAMLSAPVATDSATAASHCKVTPRSTVTSNSASVPRGATNAQKFSTGSTIRDRGTLVKPYLAAFLLFSLTGCTTTAPRPLIETTRIYDAPFEKVWSSTVAALSSQYPIKAIEKNSGLIATDIVSGSVKDYGYAPSVLLAIWSQGRHTMTAFVKPIDGQHTSVNLTAHLEGFDMNGSKTWHIWNSNGSLEASLFQKIGAGL